ncbi:MAG: cupredoxin domain-containing protein [Actinobacteria bacterium]|nr:cupredoxin domain-containing protein [Actinomycetota bacterium]
MRSSATGRLLAVAGAFALTLAACSSDDDGSAGGSGTGGAPAASDCKAAAGLSGPIEDRGTAEASGGSITLDANEFAFSPTCVDVGGGESLEVTVTNSGSALHNLSVESLGIDEDVQAGQTITVEVTLPESGAVPFVCKYHVANGMQGAFLTE